jgi:hypothetical protein
MGYQTAIIPHDGIELIETSFTGLAREELLTHYPESKNIIGRRALYNIFYNGRKVGLIGLQGCSLPMRPVIDFVWSRNKKLDREFAKTYFDVVMNNNIFRLDYKEKNLATQVLRIFRKKAFVDIKKKYGVELKAIISLCYGTNKEGIERIGTCYKADNWAFLGKSKGARKLVHGIENVGTEEYVQTTKKNIYCYIYNKKE